MQRLSLVLLLLPCAAAAADAKAMKQGGARTLTPGFDLSWNVTQDGDEVRFELTCPLEKYCAIGVAPSGTMFDGDTVMCWVGGDGMAVCEDGWSTGHSIPEADAQQDVKVQSSSSSQKDGSWTVVFLRKATTNDPHDTPLATDGTSQPLIWAHGPLLEGRPAVHDIRGSVKVTWAQAPTSVDFQEAGFSLDWVLEEEETLSFIMTCPAGSYCAFGLQPEGKMPKADIITCWADHDGTPQCEDNWAEGRQAPLTDTQNDVRDVNGTFLGDDEGWVFSFRRAVDTQDAAQDYPFYIDGSAQKVIYAIGPVDGDGRLRQHVRKGNVDVRWAPDKEAPTNKRRLAAGFNVEWRTEEDAMSFTVACPRLKYCAIGFNPLGDMDDSDAMVCWLPDGATEAHCEDTYIEGMEEPTVDAQQDLKVVSTDIKGGGAWSVTFVRPLETHDGRDALLLIDGVPQVMIWAVGPVISGRPARHTASGSTGVTFAPDQHPPHILPIGLELGDGFSFNWAVDVEQQMGIFTILCREGRYCGFGLQHIGLMPNADIVMCWVAGTGLPVCVDTWSTGRSPPEPDESQDMELLNFENRGSAGWLLTVSRKAITGDVADTVYLFKETQTMIWATGPTTADGPQKHTLKGHFDLMWMTPPRLVLPDPVPPTRGELLAPWIRPSLVLANGFSMTWQFRDEKIDVGMSCPAGQYCAVGIGAGKGVMLEADVILCLPNETGCADTWTYDYDLPVPDESQDIEVGMYVADADSWAVLFSRPLKATEPDVDRAIDPETQQELVWAVGDADQTKHTMAGARQVWWPGYGPVPDSTRWGRLFDGAVRWWRSQDGHHAIFNLTCPAEESCRLAIPPSDGIYCDIAAGGYAACSDLGSGGDVFVHSWVLGEDFWSVLVSRNLSPQAQDGVVEVRWVPGTGAPAQEAHVAFSATTDPNTSFSSPASPPSSGPKELAPGFTASWRVEGTVLRVRIGCQAGRYCALGINKEGTDNMIPSDAWFCEDGSCEDQTCTARERCPPDAIQDLRVEEGTVSGGAWTATFLRDLAPADPQDVLIDPESSAILIYATGATGEMHDYYGSIVVEKWSSSTLSVSVQGSRTRETQLGHVVTAAVVVAGFAVLAAAVTRAAPVLGRGGIAAAASGCILFAAVLIVASGDYRAYSSRTTAFAAAAGGAAQFLVSLALYAQLRKVSPCLHLISLPFERALWWHRLIGRLGWAAATLHAIAIWGSGRWSFVRLASVKPLDTAGTTDGASVVYPGFGFAAWLCYGVLVFMSLPKVRRGWWRLFAGVHVVSALCTVLFVVLHLSGGGLRNSLVFLPPVALYLVDASLRIRDRSLPATLLSLRRCGSRYVAVTIDPHGSFPHPVKPGMYCFVSIPRIDPFSAHPFSIASSPKTRHLTFYVKSMGSRTWTDQLCRLSASGEEEVPFVKVSVEGPYGKIGFDPIAHPLILIAGGVGVTPMLSILESLPQEHEAYLLWSVRDAELVELVRDQLLSIVHRNQAVRVALHFTGDEVEIPYAGDGREFEVIPERPDFSFLCKNASKAVAVCGPRSMVAAVKKCVPRTRAFPLHIETFEL